LAAAVATINKIYSCSVLFPPQGVDGSMPGQSCLYRSALVMGNEFNIF
jgi:hypothetical protein